MDRQPTKAEQEKFWEWCEFPIEKTAYGRYPDINLNNIFLYAVPKLIETGYNYELVGWSEGQHKAIINKLCKGWSQTCGAWVSKDPAMALFWVITEEVINETSASS